MQQIEILVCFRKLMKVYIPDMEKPARFQDPVDFLEDFQLILRGTIRDFGIDCRAFLAGSGTIYLQQPFGRKEIPAAASPGTTPHNRRSLRRTLTEYKIIY